MTLAVHTYLGILWRTWGFMAFMAVGCVYVILGYAGRIMLWVDLWSFPSFMIQMVCITGVSRLFYGRHLRDIVQSVCPPPWPDSRLLNIENPPPTTTSP